MNFARAHVKLAILIVPFALALYFAIACSLDGYLPAKTGGHNRSLR